MKNLISTSRRFTAKLFISIFLLLFMFPTITVKGGVLITDAESGEPLPRASIFDNKGLFIGISTDNGEVPENIPADSYPLSIRYIGYDQASVDSPDAGTVSLTESSYELPEIVVNNVDHNLLHIIAYVRVFSSGVNSTDTLNYFTERIVDFMIPLDKKAKYKGWKNSRVLAERAYQHKKRNNKYEQIDTLIYIENRKSNGTSYNLAEKFIIPEALLAGDTSQVVIDGKYWPKDTWNVIGDSYFLLRDNLADSKDHKKSPAILKMLGMTADMTKYDEFYKFTPDSKGSIRADRIAQAAYMFDIIMRGKLIKWASGQGDPITMSSYGELFVIDREYLTADQAKELKKDPPVIDAATFKAPDHVPAIPEKTQLLKEAVIKAHPSAH